MPLHPQVKPILEMFAKFPALGSMSPQQTRDLMRLPPAPGRPVYRTEDRLVAGPGGGILTRIYTPLGNGPFPALVWFHGGGWVLGNLDGADATCRSLCNEAGCVVVSVDYRLAPEHKFPAAAEDCYAVTSWAHNSGSLFNIDPNRIAVGGDSAGGNLAAVVGLMAKERGGPALRFQLLAYPVTDRDYSTKSYKDNAEGYLLTTASMKWFWDHYLRNDQDAKNPHAAPMQARDMTGLPAAMIITAEFDPLRDEGEAYGKRLQQAGVSTVVKRYDGMIHGFFGMPGVDIGAQVVTEAAQALRKALA
ncbi:MAG: alpha/beta hydrolase [SAR202 cluster bacterium]|nr:alpha/beta hydrolase [SAR202 cluster bacterium]